MMYTAAQWQARHTRWMRGWDDAIAGRHANPYNRSDYRDDYERGYRACMENRALPPWYQEWTETAKRR